MRLDFFAQLAVCRFKEEGPDIREIFGTADQHAFVAAEVPENGEVVPSDVGLKREELWKIVEPKMLVENIDKH